MFDNTDMKKARRVNWNKWGPVVLAVVAVALFLYLRLRNLGHTLNWDEARYVLCIRSYTGGLEGQWSGYVNLHPPLYLWMCAFLDWAFDGGPISFELISVLFSLATLLLVGRMARFLFDRWTGALSMLFLAALPASTILDTWIKQDAVAIFFLVLTIYLCVREKYVLGGLALGLGMLSKETAVFSLPAIGVYALACWQRDKILGVVKIGLIGAALSFWWYLFVSNSLGLFGGVFLGTNSEAETFAPYWYYYFHGLPYDLGWCILVAAIVGLVFCFRRSLQGSRIHLLPAVWFLFIYAFLSISYGKSFWLIAPALPAAAILAAIGTVESVKLAGGYVTSERLSRVLKGALAGTLIILAVVGGVFTSNARYNYSRGFFLDMAVAARQEADFILGTIGKEEKVFMVHGERFNGDPSLFYYLGDAALDPGVAWMRADPEDAASYVMTTGANWIYFERTDTYTEEFIDFLKRTEELLPIEAVYQGASYSYLIKLGKRQQ